MVIPQHAAEPLTTCDLAGRATHFVAWFDDPIVEPLMAVNRWRDGFRNQGQE